MAKEICALISWVRHVTGFECFALAVVADAASVLFRLCMWSVVLASVPQFVRGESSNSARHTTKKCKKSKQPRLIVA